MVRGKTSTILVMGLVVWLAAMPTGLAQPADPPAETTVLITGEDSGHAATTPNLAIETSFERGAHPVAIGFPALSADGTQVALAVSDPYGPVSHPDLTIRILSVVDGAVVVEHAILGVSENLGREVTREEVDRRMSMALTDLTSGGFRSLEEVVLTPDDAEHDERCCWTGEGAGLSMSFDPERLLVEAHNEAGGAVLMTALAPVPAVYPDELCTYHEPKAERAYADLERDIIVLHVAYRGTDDCWEPGPQDFVYTLTEEAVVVTQPPVETNQTGGIFVGLGELLVELTLGHPVTHETSVVIPSRVCPPGGTPDPFGTCTGWMLTTSFDHPIADQTATLLNNGLVLVTGGQDDGFKVVSEAWLYDPATATWRPTGSMAFRRAGHTATLLNDGRVLVAGGWFVEGYSGNLVLDTAEVYDPATGRWTTTNTLSAHRQAHAATLLADGRVLVTGGSDQYYMALGTADLFDPTTGTWSPVAAMTTPRYSHTATLMPDGRVLAVGGLDPSSSPTPSAEIYDPLTNAWLPAPAMTSARDSHNAVLLSDGRVLVSGGTDLSYNPTATAEVYDATLRMWRSAGDMASPRRQHEMVVLPDGRVLATSGLGSSYITTESSDDIFDPTTSTWHQYYHAAPWRTGTTLTVLPTGQVLRVGGNFYRDEYTFYPVRDADLLTVFP